MKHERFYCQYPARICSRLPDVEPWYDTEDEDEYSDDPEDGYPYDE